MELNEVIKDCNSLIDTYKAANKNSWKGRKSISNFLFTVNPEMVSKVVFMCVQHE